jgi:hypothetical protein
MIHTIYIDDSSSRGKLLIRNLQKEKSIVRFKTFENDTNDTDGYMTSELFRTRVKQDLVDKLKANGCL